MNERPYLSIVVPAYNEGTRISGSLDVLVRHLSEQSYTWDIVVVDDGSSDGTADVVRERASQSAGIRLENIPHSGKGWAVRHSMLAASGSLRMMCDADMAMPAAQIERFTRLAEDGCDVVIGSREAPGSSREGEPSLRHFRGRVFNRLVRTVAVRGFDDTQCGFKCFRGDVAAELFKLQRVRGFGFDVEMLHMASMWGLKIAEVPIDWRHNPDSKVRSGADTFAMAEDVLRVGWRGLLGAYGPRPEGSG